MSKYALLISVLLASGFGCAEENGGPLAPTSWSETEYEKAIELARQTDFADPGVDTAE